MSDTMQVEQVNISDIVPADYNPRQISDDALKRLTDGIKEFGFVQPVVCNRSTGRIVGGHQRCKAAKLAGLESVPVVWIDVTEGKEKALNLALNKISGEWDDDLLKELLDGMEDEDLLMSGFGQDELEELLESDADDLRYLEDFDTTPKPDPVWVLISTNDVESANIVAAINNLDLKETRVEVS